MNLLLQFLFLASLVCIPTTTSFTQNVTPRGKSVRSTFQSSSIEGGVEASQREGIKERLLQLISETPSNMPTSPSLTNEILDVVRQLESTCPTPDEEVLSKLGGTWELLWTAQDQKSDEWGLGPLKRWINPLENQSYSNNPSADRGRANPVLPRPIQDQLEKSGLISQDADPIRSSQAIDLKKQQVRNVVGFTLPAPGKPKKASLTVSVDFKPNVADQRKIDVKFQACKVVINPLNFNIPLGVIGPTGWLRTGYIDENMRITRGHKGSIFVLLRPGK